MIFKVLCSLTTANTPYKQNELTTNNLKKKEDKKLSSFFILNRW